MKKNKVLSLALLSAVISVNIMGIESFYNNEANLKAFKAANECDIPKLQEAIKDGANLNESAVTLTTYKDVNNAVHKELYHLNKPLSVAALKCKCNVLQFMIENGADVNAKNPSNGETAMFNAVGASYDDGGEKVEFLVKHGANINVVEDGDWAPISLVASPIREKMLLKMKDLGANFEWKGGSVLMHSIPYPSFTQRLIDLGANVNANIGCWGTPLHYAITKHGMETAAVLLKNGANPNLATPYGETPLHTAVALSDAYGTEGIELLLDKGANADAFNIRGESVLDYATKYIHSYDRREKVIALLKERGAKERGRWEKMGIVAKYNASRIKNAIIG